MLYLIESSKYIFNRRSRCLKIGFTDNLEQRMIAYSHMNPGTKLLKTREGDKDLEKHLHTYFSRYKLPGEREWFIFDSRIIRDFDKIELTTIIPSIKGFCKFREDYINKNISKLSSKELNRAMIEYACKNILLKPFFKQLNEYNEKLLEGLIGKTTLFYINSLGPKKVSELDYDLNLIRLEYKKLFNFDESKLEKEEIKYINPAEINERSYYESEIPTIYFIKIQSSECEKEVYTLMDKAELKILTEILPNESIFIIKKSLQNLNYNDYPSYHITENYKNLFFEQPEIKKGFKYKTKRFNWYEYSEIALKLFQENGEENIKEMVFNYLSNTQNNESYFFGFEIISQVCAKGNDMSGSFMFEELKSLTSDRYSLASKFLNIENIKNLYSRKSRRSLLYKLCPTKEYFLEIVKDVSKIWEMRKESTIRKRQETDALNQDSDNYLENLNTYQIDAFKNLKKDLENDLLITGDSIVERVLEILDNDKFDPNALLKSILISHILPNDISESFKLLGKRNIKKLNSWENISKEVFYLKLKLSLKDKIEKIFEINKSYPKWYIESSLNTLFDELNCSYKMITKNLFIFKLIFNVEECLVKTPDNEKHQGYTILSIKDYHHFSLESKRISAITIKTPEEYQPEEIKKVDVESIIKNEVLRKFIIGNYYKKEDIERILNDIPKRFGVKKNYGVEDLKLFFNIEQAKKNDNFYRIVSLSDYNIDGIS